VAADLRLDEQRDNLNLTGTWQRLLENADGEVWKTDVADKLAPWKAVEVPSSNLMPAEDGQDAAAARQQAEKTVNVWLRRSFEVTEAQAARDVLLRWNGIRFGATAWINGRKITEHVPVGPHLATVPRGTLKSGRNEIVLKIPGWAGMPRSKSNYPLTPTGGATQSWGGKGPAVYQDLWLEFYDRVYLRRVLAMPDLAAKSVTFRVWFGGVVPLPKTFSLAIDVHRPENAKDASPMVAQSKIGGAPMQCDPLDFTVKLDSVAPWTPETPHLYRAELTLTTDDRPCDKLTFRFGMRQITVKDGHFALNGRPLWLRGSNLVNEWLWGDKFNQNAKQYIIDEARAMSLNCFRTHTQPPPADWLDIADAHGMMILAEMPLLYNHGDFGYTPEELQVLHRNTLVDAEGWITRMWNHPSVVLWVLSNESRLDNEWEAGPLFQAAKQLDPTRLCMRTGEGIVGTPDMVDIHTCFNVNRDADGQLPLDMAARMARKDPARPLCNTEYMNIMWDPTSRWMGKDKDPGFPLAFAECATEHTEAMRRLQFDCLLPYMYAGWTRLGGKLSWREDYPTPMAAALHSAMAPVLASLDVFDRNYAAGQTVKSEVAIINETHANAKIRLRLVVTPQNPVFVPDAQALAAAVWSESQDIMLAAESLVRRSVTWQVPAAEGTYYLVAVVERDGAAPVASQRTVHAVDRTKTLAGLKGRRVLVLCGDNVVVDWLKAAGAEVATTLTTAKIEADVVLIWRGEWRDPVDRSLAALKEFAAGGGRIVVADSTDWPWKELADVHIGVPDPAARNPIIGSRAHLFEGAAHRALRDVPPDWLWRWNGLPGEVASEAVLEDSAALAQGQKIAWVSRPIYTTLFSLPMGRGEITFCQLKVRQRITRDGVGCDPVAERVLANLLAK
jgi:hypothetical protein